MPEALAAGLKIVPVPEVEIVSNFAQVGLLSFASHNPTVMKNYMKAVVHALALLIYRRDNAMEIVAGEPMGLMKISGRAELRRQVDSIAELLRVRPYPTAEAIMNSSEIAAREYGSAIENPLTLWDLHWLQELDDEGFIDDLVSRLE